MKKLLIAGTTSGSGKTTITLGLLKALSEAHQVQAYKIGPDYVDTKFHTRITGRPSRNIDSFLTPDDPTLNYLFTENTQDVDFGIVEGVMGLYDGLGSDKDAFSTSSIAKKMSLPVILVIDAHGISTSAAALVKGYLDFDPKVNICGVIVNNVMGASHYELVKAAIDRYVKIPVLGYLPHNAAVSLPSRQLGLVPDDEVMQVDQKISEVAEEMKAHVDISLIEHLARDDQRVIESPVAPKTSSLTVGIAKDDAFNFYYADNISLLKQSGIRLVPFSPIKDAHLPDVDVLYFGGGYPEEFAEQLSKNQSMLKDVRQFSLAGKPIYAECGGLMYLGQHLKVGEENYEMVGVLDGDSEMTSRLKRFGYCYAKSLKTNQLAAVNETVVGHEFHHSVFTVNDGDQLKPVLKMTKVRDQQVVSKWTGGFQVRNTFASYLHIHFYQNKTLFNRLVTQWEAAIHAD